MSYISFQPSDHFNTKLYTGNSSSTQAVTGVGFQPDWVWIKQRNLAYSHVLFDAVRGVGKNIQSNSTAAEETNNSSGYLSAFDSDGFTLSQGSSNGDRVNGAYNYVGWNWKANGAGSSNTDGSITSTVSANTTAGFSIVKWTGTGASATVGHGLGVTPDMIICKNLDGTAEDWVVWNNSFSASQFIRLNTNASVATSTGMWDNTLPTSSVFSLKNEEKNNNTGQDIISYCFAEKKGFSKFGSYTGNGSTDGAFIYTGFKPAFVLVKNTAITDNWSIFDNKRIGYNAFNYVLYSDITNVGSNGLPMDILSNGFKWRTDAAMVNGSGQSHIFMAFAEAPLVSSNGVPATAR
jgi:hypothetical protein